MAEFRLLETLVLRSIESDETIRSDLSFKFDTTLALINDLLDNIKLVRSDKTGFEIKSKNNNQTRDSNTLSSGESELVSLAIEILAFAYQANHVENSSKKSLLLLDEPDVHLHPDLQDRLIKLLVAATKDKPITTIIATHSTAIPGALSRQPAHIHFMKKDQNDLVFIPIDQQLKDILPIFGAHPLSNIFNQNPVLLVEGEDDERIWQQAVRSSQGKINLWPCEVGTKDRLNEYEDKVSALIDSLYDDAKAFSLRDRDDEPYEIDNKPYVTRSRLNCYAAENLILSDDVLASLGTN
jgi:energy-coupling factor transporter ATP-binding protein EcfA2